MINTIKSIHKEFLNLHGSERKNIIAVAINMFLVLFSYSMIRSTSTAIFLQSHGAKNTPLVWLYSVIALSISVSLFNKFQKTKSVFFLYKYVVLATFVIFSLSNIFYYIGFNPFAYIYYIWKEVYIVLLVHLSLGYLNTKVEYRVAKLTYGPLGALGSLGGVLGGECTSYLIPFVNSLMSNTGLIIVGLIGLLLIASTIFVFKEGHSVVLKNHESVLESPLSSIKKVKSYVFLVASIVAVSQFVINLANFKFNLGIESFISGAEEKGAYLGKINSQMNMVSFLFQIFLIPIIFKIFKVKWVHFFIPLIYMILFFATLGPMGTVASISILFVSYKGLDYSIFSTAKEMLYFPLGSIQRYGAKYVVDMVVYRASKMLISVVLLYFNTAFFVDCSLGICLIIWIILTAFLFARAEENLELHKI